MTVSSGSDNGGGPVGVQSREVTVCNAKGLHARAAALFVKRAEEFDAVVEVTREHETVSGGSIMDLLLLAAGKGTCLTISASGRDAAAALAALGALVEDGFLEED